MNKRRFPILVIVIAYLLLVGCHSEPKTTAEKIDALKRQVESDAKALKTIEDKYVTPLQRDFLFCDSLLQYMSQEQMDANFETLNLTHAYLLQFSSVQPGMVQKMGYVTLQLDRLKSDLESQFVSDSLAQIYLNTESMVADTLHNQVVYFQDRLSQCQKDLNVVKKTKIKRQWATVGFAYSLLI